ncbi:MAG TPA: glycosyltransferase family 4 protein [Patescibacteria group bacterium]|nr:glycosyltransferase family 4 protein [Patescibacteria group bacterium]
MKIGIYSPYLDSLGGGERYVFSLAEHWSQIHNVSVFWDDNKVKAEVQKRFSIDLAKVSIVANVFQLGNSIGKLMTTSSYDLIFFLSDGSIPLSAAKYNILHFQVPFSHISMPFWKAFRYQRIVCNSEFTKKHLDPHLVIPRTVIYPPVDVSALKPGRKSKILLSVGRFNGHYGAKKQNVLIETFRKLYKSPLLKGWKLVIAGGLLSSDTDYFNSLKLKAKGLPVEFYPNCSYETLNTHYSAASIYWHAAGYGETKPEHMEHFGITTVEAMAAGAVPVVFDGGGQPEIIANRKSGFLWNTTEELIQETTTLIKNTELRSAMAAAALKSSTAFTKDRFCRSFDALLLDITGTNKII